MSAIQSIEFGVGSMIGFGLGDFIAKTVLAKATPYRAVLVAQSVGALPFLAATLIYDLAMPDESLLLLTAVSGAISTIASLSFYKALSFGKASLVSPVSSCQTVVAVLLSVFVLKETVSGLLILLIALVFLGILLIAVQTEATKSTASNLSILLALVVVFLGGSVTIVQKWIAMNAHYLLGFFLSRFFILVFLTVLFPSLRSKRQLERPRIYAGMAILGLINVSAFFVWFMGMRVGYVSIVTLIANSATAVTITLAHLFLNERVLLHQKIGILTIILGIALLSAASS